MQDALYPQQMVTRFFYWHHLFADTNNHKIKQNKSLKLKKFPVVDENISWGTPYHITFHENGNLYYTEFFS